MLSHVPGDRGRICACAWRSFSAPSSTVPHRRPPAATDRTAAAELRRGGGDEPTVTDLDLYATRESERAQDLDPGREIELSPQQLITIEAEPVDQYGRRFSADRFHMGADLGRNCREVVSVSKRSAGELRFTAGRDRGASRALLWVSSNLNLEFELRFDVTGLDTAQYTRGQTEAIAERLYRAVLQREIDGGARTSAVAEI